jgi:hypothetical protein
MAQEEDSDDEHVILMVTTAFGDQTNEDSGWYLDTGCSNHMTGRKDWLVDLDEGVKSKVKFADDSVLRAEGMGNVVIQRRDGKT